MNNPKAGLRMGFLCRATPPGVAGTPKAAIPSPGGRVAPEGGRERNSGGNLTI